MPAGSARSLTHGRFVLAFKRCGWPCDARVPGRAPELSLMVLVPCEARISAGRPRLSSRTVLGPCLARVPSAGPAPFFARGPGAHAKPRPRASLAGRARFNLIGFVL